MKRLLVQIQPARSPGLNADAAAARLQDLAAAVVSCGKDGGSYLNVNFRPTDVRGLWPAVRQLVQSDQELAACSIVCCEGEWGWDDYRLLHHFDPSEPLDEVS